MTDKRVPQDRAFDLKFQWLEDGETILIPGEKHLVFVQKDDETNQWGKIEEEKISHKTEITSILSISNEILMTYSNQDQPVKIWKLDDEGCNCLHEKRLEAKALSFKYDNETMTLAIFDEKCHISVVQWDFATDKAVPQQSKSLNGESEIDLDDFEMADLDLQDEEQEKKLSVADVMEKEAPV
jgi:hypothetical protein